MLGFHGWIRKPVDVSTCLVTDSNDLGGEDTWINEAEIVFEPRMCPRCRLLNKEDSTKLIALLVEGKKERKKLQ